MTGLLALLALVGVVVCRHHDESHRSIVYYPHQFHKNVLCESARCTKEDVCVVKGETARCLEKNALHHPQHHEHEKFYEFGTGKRIHHGHHNKTKFAERQLEKQAVPRHFEVDQEHERECSQKELDAMGGRLLQWFSDIHRQQAGQDRSLPRHSVACRPDVAWMFEQWDGDNSGRLSLRELAPLETDEHEPCMRAFLDRCDDEPADEEISVDEWCDCFTFSNDLRHEPPCHRAKHSADPHLLGVFHPRCDPEGFYKAEQCHDGQCWCVDKFGREMDKSRTNGHFPDCGQYGEEMSEELEKELSARL